MAGIDPLAAMAKRSIASIKTELDFLADASFLSSQQLSTILAQLPTSSQLNQSRPNPSRQASPANNNSFLNIPIRSSTNSPPEPDTHQQQQPSYYAPSLSPTHGPAAATPQSIRTAYTTPAPSQPTLGHATAIYAYQPTDPGDLGLAPHDRIIILEFMNAEWWKGRSERTGQEGIFPRSYVKDDTFQAAPMNDYGDKNPASYGNMPMAVSQGQQQQPMTNQNGQRVPGKGEELGKRFGKRLGNAAIFGAGATMGADIVNSIF